MASRTYADRQTYTRVLQCSHASVGLAQARPNKKHTMNKTILTTSFLLYAYVYNVHCIYDMYCV